MDKVVKDLKKLGFNAPIKVQDLKKDDCFFLTPKGDLYKTFETKIDGETNQINISAIEIRTMSEVEFNLGKGIWVDKVKDPESYKHFDYSLNDCMSQILNYFNSQNWKVVDDSGLPVLRKEIHTKFNFYKKKLQKNATN